MSVEETIIRLRRWGISEEAVQKFKDARITDDLFPFLEDDVLDDLITSPLELVRFRVHRTKEFTAKQSKIFATADADGLVTIAEDGECVLDQLIGESSVEKNAALDELPKDQIPAIDGCWDDSAEIDLEKLLKKSAGGTAIWNLYQIKKELRDCDRDAIAASIIDHELQFDLNRRISAGRFVYLSKQVEKTFPSETPSVWAVIEKGRFVTGKGKLYSRWSNTRRKYIQLQLIPRSRRGRSTSNETGRTTVPVPNHGEFTTSESIETEKQTDDTILWLKNNGTPWVTVEKHWSETSAARRRILITEKTGVFEYLNEYPALKDPKAYLLLEIDFDVLYPDKAKVFFATWPNLRNFLIKKFPKVCGICADSIQDPTAQTNFLLINLSLIFRVTIARKQKKQTKEWRPSKSEVQEAFVLHVKVIGDLDVKLQERRARLARFNCQLQPLIAVVGPSFEEINQSFVILDLDSRFEVETPLRAVDAVFKCFYALDAQYPAEATHVWQFIQRGVYRIPRGKNDPYFTDVEKLLNDYSNFHN